MKNNIFANIATKIDKESFEDILSTEGIKIERIISKGHTTPKDKWYDQNTNEWVIVLKGKAVLSFQNSDDVELEKGDYINIPAHTKHKVAWTTPEGETIWLAIHY